MRSQSSNVKNIGYLYFLYPLLYFAGYWMLFNGSPRLSFTALFFLSVFFGVPIVLNTFIGFGLLEQRRWARVFAIVTQICQLAILLFIVWFFSIRITLTTN